MRHSKTQARRYLITLHFDRIFEPATVSGCDVSIRNFLTDVGKLALEDGMNLMAEYSIVSGETGTHAHIIANWMPTTRIKDKRTKKSFNRLRRHPILKLMREHFFRTDSQTERIKAITETSKKVKRYIDTQSNGNQTVILSGIFSFQDFVPHHSETKIQSYYRRPQITALKNPRQIGCLSKLLVISYIITYFLLAIIYSMVILLN